MRRVIDKSIIDNYEHLYDHKIRIDCFLSEFVDFIFLLKGKIDRIKYKHHTFPKPLGRHRLSRPTQRYIYIKILYHMLKSHTFYKYIIKFYKFGMWIESKCEIQHSKLAHLGVNERYTSLLTKWQTYGGHGGSQHHQQQSKRKSPASVPQTLWGNFTSNDLKQTHTWIKRIKNQVQFNFRCFQFNSPG